MNVIYIKIYFAKKYSSLKLFRHNSTGSRCVNINEHKRTEINSYKG